MKDSVVLVVKSSALDLIEELKDLIIEKKILISIVSDEDFDIMFGEKK